MAPSVAEPTVRKIVQVSISNSITTVLCNDGTLWWLDQDGWMQLPSIPQPTPEEQP